MRCFWLISLAAILMATGCASRPHDRDTLWVVRKYGATDAHVQTVRGMPFLRVNGYLLDRLENASAAPNVDAARSNLEAALTACHRLATASITNEINRLPRQAAAQGLRALDPQEQPPVECHGEFRSRYLSLIEPGWQSLLSQARGAATLDDVDAIAQSILRQVNPSIKDHYGKGPLLALVMATTPEPHGPLDLGGSDIDLYEPEADVPDGTPLDSAEAPSDTWRLLARYAPRIAQERVSNATYSEAADRIGAAQLEGDYDDLSVVIDPSAPRVYAYAQPTIINDSPHTQLTYTYWFPERPALRPGDAEAGAIDGATLRITLDRNNQPAIFETILNCGCFHRCYVSASLDAAAAKVFGPPLDGKVCSVARRMNGPPDWEVAQTVDVLSNGDARPIIFSRAGYHGIAGILFDDSELQSRAVLARRAYVLTPYADLENLPTSYGRGSMFGADGLVHKAGRVEGWLLAGTGMLSAGQPRQRGSQRICWDQYDFDDPRLLERCLRLPPDF